MTSFFYRTDGIGLSAPQVGVNVQLMVFNPVGERGEGEEIVLINPRVSKYSMNRTLFNEGCLSFPGIHADVKVWIWNPFLLLHYFESSFPFCLVYEDIHFWTLKILVSPFAIHDHLVHANSYFNSLILQIKLSF